MRRLLALLPTILLGCSLSMPVAAGLAPDAPTVLITGANRGIGLEFSRQYAERGWNVIATARDPDRADELQALAAEHPQLVIEALDVTDFAAVGELAERYREQPIDVLLSNAAITPRDPSVFRGLAQVNFELARQSYEVNTLAPVRLAQAFVDHVAASETRKIVALSSKAGSFAEGPELPIMYEYRASKAALNMLIQTMSFEVRRKGITVVTLSPGIVNTTPGVSMPGGMDPDESVRLMIAVIDGITADDNGLFLNFAEGEQVQW